MSSEWTEESNRAEARLRRLLCKLSDQEFLEALAMVERIGVAQRAIVIEAMRQQLSRLEALPVVPIVRTDTDDPQCG